MTVVVMPTMTDKSSTRSLTPASNAPPPAPAAAAAPDCAATVLGALQAK